MFRSSSSSSSSATAVAPSSPIADSSEGSDDAPDEVVLSPACWNGNVRCTSVEFANAYTTQQLLIEYDHVIETEDDPCNWELFIRRYTDIKERSNIPLVAIFGWTTRRVARLLSHARPDVATGSPSCTRSNFSEQATSTLRSSCPPTWGYFMTSDPVQPNNRQRIYLIYLQDAPCTRHQPLLSVHTCYQEAEEETRAREFHHARYDARLQGICRTDIPSPPRYPSILRCLAPGDQKHYDHVHLLYKCD